MVPIDSNTPMLGMWRVWEFVVVMTACVVAFLGAFIIHAGHPLVGAAVALVAALVLGLMAMLILLSLDQRREEAIRRYQLKRG